MGKPRSVDEFLSTLAHTRMNEIMRLRTIVLGATEGISERVKWNAPSFCSNGDDRVTMRLQPGNRVQLVFHRGAKPRPGDGFSFADPSGLIDWATADRGTVTITGADMLEDRAADLSGLVCAWMAATA